MQIQTLQIAQNHYTRSLAYCIQTASPRYGGVTYSGAGSPGDISNITGPPQYPNAMNVQMLTFRGWRILGQTFTLSRNTVLYYGSQASPFYAPYIVTSDYALGATPGGGDFAMLILGNPTTDSNYNRWMHQGRLDYNPTTNLSAMGNFSAQTVSASSGKTTFFAYDGSVMQGWADAASTIDGSTHCYVFTRNAGVFKIFRDGLNVTTAQSSASNYHVWGSNLQELAIGGCYASTEDRSANCTIPLQVGWNRAMGDVEAMTLSACPWLLFDAPTSPIFHIIPGSASAGVFSQKTVYLDQAVSRAALW